jgi:hypothetical protein
MIGADANYESQFEDSLLLLVATGSSILTELQRLSKRVPEVGVLR